MGLPSSQMAKKILLSAIVVGVLVGAVVSVIGPIDGLPGEVATAAIVALVVFCVGTMLSALGILRGD